MWHTWKEEKCLPGLVTRPEGKRLLGRPRCRWKNSITMDVGDAGLGHMDWLNLAEDRFKWWTFVNTLTFKRHKIARSLTSWEPFSFRRGLCCMKLLTIYRPSDILGQCKMPCRMFIAFFFFFNFRMKYNIEKCHNKVAVLRTILNTLKWLSFLQSCMCRTDLLCCLVTKSKKDNVPQNQAGCIQSFNFIV